jgi:hypothetical protein
MTILAGAWRPDRAPIDGAVTSALRSALSRHPEDGTSWERTGRAPVPTESES